MTRTPLSEPMRLFLQVAGLVLVAVLAVLGAAVYGLTALDSKGEIALDVADVEGTWTAEDGSGARLVIRRDGSVELSKEAQIMDCAALMWADGRVAKGTWAFGDSDDPRMVFVKARGSAPGDACSFDFRVVDGGDRTSGLRHAYVRGGDPD
ncbi:hypothetical protein [Streptomyces sp. NPDC058401]|uniref:hypothetical protein n=1 Tax=Streptomyces sp. NPDC058401 TaxID=3346480 RepID=UPI00365EDF36